MDALVREGERVDDLKLAGLKLIQHPQKYRFSADAVYLANFARLRRGEAACDFCTGGGAVAVLLAGKFPAGKIYGIELQAYYADLAARNVKLNGLEERVEILRGDVKEAAGLLPGKVRAVTCNPPYRKAGSGKAAADAELELCRCELAVTLPQIVSAAAGVLERGGRLYLVHLAARLGEAIRELYASGFSPRRLRFVQARSDAPPKLALLEGILGGRCGLQPCPPLVLQNADGGPTEEAASMNLGERLI